MGSRSEAVRESSRRRLLPSFLTESPREEQAASQTAPGTGLSAWVGSADPEELDLLPLDSVHPES